MNKNITGLLNLLFMSIDIEKEEFKELKISKYTKQIIKLCERIKKLNWMIEVFYIFLIHYFYKNYQ